MKKQFALLLALMLALSLPALGTQEATATPETQTTEAPATEAPVEVTPEASPEATEVVTEAPLPEATQAVTEAPHSTSTGGHDSHQPEKVEVVAHGHGFTPVDTFTPATAPKYPVGTKVTILEGHMPGMKGAEGTVSGAFDTVLYAIDYVHAETGEQILNHKWVVQEEILYSGIHPFEVGDKVVLLPGHISGMGGEGVVATIVSVHPGVAYMVHVQPTDGGPVMENHQWMAESELALAD